MCIYVCLRMDVSVHKYIQLSAFVWEDVVQIHLNSNVISYVPTEEKWVEGQIKYELKDLRWFSVSSVIFLQLG